MNEFVIHKVNTGGYNRFLLCLSFESIVAYRSLIESSPLITEQSGKIIIDQLFVTGNGKNRFIGCDYVNGILDFNTAQIVQPNDYYKQITVKWLNTHYMYVDNSILTESQRRCVRECVPF